MVNDTIKALAFLKDLTEFFSEIFKKIFGKEKMKSYEKYMKYSCKRKSFNNIVAATVNIEYVFKDTPDDDEMTALDVKYIISGAAGEYMEDIMLYFNMQEYDKENICLRAYDSRETSDANPIGDEVTTQIRREDNRGKLFGDNGAYWRIPFFNSNPRNNNHVCTTILLPWKRFCSINSTATLIVDPRNYSKNTRKISISFNTKATKYNVKHIKICEFDRKSRKPLLKGMQCDLYNKNNIRTEEELLAKIDIDIDEEKENSVFVIKVTY